MGAVLIEGPKLCGKSTTAVQQAESVLNMEPGPTLSLAAINPKLLLQGTTPRLIGSFGTSFVGKLIYEEENQGNLFLRGQLFLLILVN